MDRINAEHLSGACPEQQALFRKVFPEGAAVDEATARYAVRAGLDVQWLARLLPVAVQRAYADVAAPVRRAYVDAEASARRAYDDAMASARRAYADVAAPVRRAYVDAEASAQRAYDDATASARRAYANARALTLVPFLKAL